MYVTRLILSKKPNKGLFSRIKDSLAADPKNLSEDEKKKIIEQHIKKRNDLIEKYPKFFNKEALDENIRLNNERKEYYNKYFVKVFESKEINDNNIRARYFGTLSNWLVYFAVATLGAHISIFSTTGAIFFMYKGSKLIPYSGRIGQVYIPKQEINDPQRVTFSFVRNKWWMENVNEHDAAKRNIALLAFDNLMFKNLYPRYDVTVDINEIKSHPKFIPNTTEANEPMKKINKFLKSNGQLISLTNVHEASTLNRSIYNLRENATSLLYIDLEETKTIVEDKALFAKIFGNDIANMRKNTQE